MSNPKLDKNDPALGIISPPHMGAAYFLKGNYFAHDGTYLFSERGGKIARVTEVVEEIDPNEIPNVPPVNEPEKNPPEAPENLTPPETVDSTPEVPNNLNEPPANATPETYMLGEYDLVAWAKGEQNYPWIAFKKDVNEKWPEINASSKATIAEGLVEKGIVKKEDVRV